MPLALRSVVGVMRTCSPRPGARGSFGVIFSQQNTRKQRHPFAEEDLGLREHTRNRQCADPVCLDRPHRLHLWPDFCSWVLVPKGGYGSPPPYDIQLLTQAVGVGIGEDQAPKPLHRKLRVCQSEYTVADSR